jgi:hypothetical protein
VFLSSPGDVVEERKAARTILKRVPAGPFLRGRITLDVVSWDDPDAPVPMLANLSPQEAVNRGLPTPAACDLTVVVLWSRMGTPLGELRKKDETPYRSGTEWEYENALEAGKDVLIYRRTSRVHVSLDDPDIEAKRRQMVLVEQFFARFTRPDGSLTAGYTPYDTVAEFTARLEQDVEAFLAGLLNAADPAPSDAQAPTRDASPNPADAGETGTAPHDDDVSAVRVAHPAASTPGRVETSAASSAIHGFLTVSARDAGRLMVVSCLMLEDPDPTRQVVNHRLEDLLHDPQLADSVEVAELRQRAFDYWRDDTEVRARLIEAMLQLPFEAYVWYGRSESGASDDRLLNRLAGGLLRDRLAANRARSLALSIDRHVEAHLPGVRTALAAAVRDIRRSDKRGVPDPTVGLADVTEPCIAVSRYVAGVVSQRLHAPTPLEVRAFERLHPSKIRLVHELGTRHFYDRRNPLR